jgi:hypothetical protein
MSRTTKLWLTAVGALCALAFGAQLASATRIEISNQGYRIIWPHVTFAETGGMFTECPMTLEGTLHSRTISKVSGSLVGYVTRAFMTEGTCTGSAQAAVVPGSLPWHVRYDSFQGTLPNITGLRFQVIGMEISAVGGLCRYRSEAGRPVNFIVHIAGTEVTNVQWDEALPITKIFGEPLCRPSLRLGGNGTATILGGTTTLRVRLVA